MRQIVLNENVVFANDLPLVLIAGINVLESRELAFEVAGYCQQVCQQLAIPLVFKASFDKANRSSVHSFRGPGLEKGLQWLADVKSHFNVPILTDVHEPFQAQSVAEVADILQLPAFLCRQTDLVTALARTGRIINIKKAQFLAPDDMRHIIDKFHENDHHQLLICERGSSFGYHNLVVDMLGFGVMKPLDYPLVFDVTHALQQPGALALSAGGRRAQVLELAKAGVAVGLAGIFLELHPDPERAKCDGPCALRLSQLQPFLEQVKAIDQLVKSFPVINTA
jgi:2-dehydro-3-deoxyphosphooctonate aldolase (KDO 8-P synthase)